MRAVTARDRWVWALSGLVTMAALAIPGFHLITSIGTPPPPQAFAMPERVFTVPDPVTSLNVQSYGGPVRVTAAPVRQVQVTETIDYVGGGPDGGPAPVQQRINHGQLNLSDSACADSGCQVSFEVTVPQDITVTVESEGGPVTVSGVAGANLDSGSGPVSAARIGGPLTVSTDGGPLVVDGVTGALRADTSGGTIDAAHVAATTVTASTGGADASIAFSSAPDTVTVSTDGGAATLIVPGGPYALTGETDDGTESVRIWTSPAAARSISVITSGGPLRIEP